MPRYYMFSQPQNYLNDIIIQQDDVFVYHDVAVRQQLGQMLPNR